MFVFISDEIMTNKDLNPSEKLLFGIISSYEHNNKVCFMSNNQLASAIGISRVQVINLLKHLQELELIEIEYLPSLGVHSNRVIKVKKKFINKNSELWKLFDAVYGKIK